MRVSVVSMLRLQRQSKTMDPLDYASRSFICPLKLRLDLKVCSMCRRDLSCGYPLGYSVFAGAFVPASPSLKLHSSSVARRRPKSYNSPSRYYLAHIVRVLPWISSLCQYREPLSHRRSPNKLCQEPSFCIAFLDVITTSEPRCPSATTRTHRLKVVQSSASMEPL